MNAMLRITTHTFYVIAMSICAVNASGCSGNDSIPSVSAIEFQKELKTDSVKLLDVRTPEEFAYGHIAGAININVQSDDFQEKAEKELSKDSPIYVYCRSGRRSLTAARILDRLGYKVVNLNGGIIEWKEEGLPITTIEK